MSSYKCMIAKIDKTIEIPGADKIQTAIVLGEQVVVSKNWEVGKIGLFFPADTQLSHEFCSNNNLYRHSHLNVDQEKTGFFDDNRRVRCQPFLKVRSEGFFCELNSLDYVSGRLWMDSEFKIGDQFDELDGQEICRKYINPHTLKKQQNQQKKKTRHIDAPLFHKHVDTEQFKYYIDKIPEGATIFFHTKVHGTSARCSYSKVVRQPITFWNKLLDKLGLYNGETWEYLNGTRNVVLYEDQYDKEGFHGSEQFRFDAMELVKPHLTKGMTVYGEIAGFANGSPIMGRHSTNKLGKEYKAKYGSEVTYAYGCKEHEFRFHVYRISITSEDGVEIDFSDAQCRKWCNDRGLNYALEIHSPIQYDGDKEKLEKLVEELTERPERLTEDYIDPSQVSEGIILRIEGTGSIIPVFYKNKSFAFKCMEGILKESGAVDIEEAS